MRRSIDLPERILRDRAHEEAAIVLVGINVELMEQRQVSESKGRATVRYWDEYCSFFEVSTREEISCHVCIEECVRSYRQLKEIWDEEGQRYKLRNEKNCVIL